MTRPELYMKRCLQLAELGAGSVAPNPMVGAVLVHEDRVLAEGYHRHFGASHAEVDCLDRVAPGSRHLLAASTLYINLEPCSHYGKTPPCTERILREGIPEVVVGSLDPFEGNCGRGITRLRQQGIRVETGLLESECLELNRRFVQFHRKHRPYIILKWAQTQDGFIAGPGKERLAITSGAGDRLVHRWRSEESAILAGSGTIRSDDPLLTNRLWSGGNPLRVILDPGGRIPGSAHVLDGSVPTLVFSPSQAPDRPMLEYFPTDPDSPLIPQILDELFRREILSLLIEGGQRVLNDWIASGLWQEARVITSPMRISQGLNAPVLEGASWERTMQADDDRVDFYRNQLP